MGTAVLIGQQRLGEKRSNIQLSTPTDIMPFYSSLCPSLPFALSLSLAPYPYFVRGRISEVGGGDQTNKQECVCVCVLPDCDPIFEWGQRSVWVFSSPLSLSLSFSLSFCLPASLTFFFISKSPLFVYFQHLQTWFLMFGGEIALIPLLCVK